MLRRAVPAVAVGVTLLAVWPPSDSAFHEPKRWLFAALALGGALLVLPKWRWTALPLIALTAIQPWHSMEAGLQAMAFAWALAAWHSDVRWLTRVVAIAGSIVGLIVVVQFFGIDPLRFAQPDVGDSRLRLYGTLGNPDFVAGALLPVAVLIIGSPRRIEWIALVAIVPALIVTRSFATLMSASVAFVVILVSKSAPLPNPLPAFAGRGGFVALIGLLGIGLIGRDLGQTVAGRRYLVSVALPHVTDAPLLGHGLGSTVLAWPTWELSFWKERCADAECVAQDPQSRFAALQDHVHADWLELLLERGILGFLAFALALAAPLRAAWRSDPIVFAAMAAILTRSLVDFPLHRPAELCLLAALAACADVSPHPTETSPTS